jgi:hypothetical protein
LSSTKKAMHSLCGKAAPIVFRFLAMVPLLSHSSSGGDDEVSEIATGCGNRRIASGRRVRVAPLTRRPGRVHRCEPPGHRTIVPVLLQLQWLSQCPSSRQVYIVGQPHTGELPTGGGRKEIPIARADVSTPFVRNSPRPIPLFGPPKVRTADCLSRHSNGSR